MTTSAAAMQSNNLQQLKKAAKQAWLYTLPLIEIATARARLAGFGAGLNTIFHVHKLLDHRARGVTTPNNDTLYSAMHLDLSEGPVTLTLPPTGERYLSVALMDAYSNNFAILGTRTTGQDGGEFQLIGPVAPITNRLNTNDQVSNPTIIRSPSNQVWALARTLVDDEADLAAACAVQMSITIQGPKLDHAPPSSPRSANWQDYFSSADVLMKLNPPPATDTALLRGIAAMGLGAGRFDANCFTGEEAVAIESGVAEAKALLHESASLSGTNIIDGWTYPRASLGDFGQDYEYRAGVALAGLAALPPVEAMYMNAKSPDGNTFDGARKWLLHFDADQLLPVYGFWSLSLYEPTDDGQLFFTENTLNRFAIGDRSVGLIYDCNGGLDIWIGHKNPGEKIMSNWLPAPPGPFVLLMRAYLPKAQLLDGAYRLPPIFPVD